MAIEEIHGFRYNGKVYATRAEAEHAEQESWARNDVEDAIEILAGELAQLMWSNWIDNGDRHRTAKGVCEDLFPVHSDRRDHADAFFRALDRAADAYEALGLVRCSKQEPQP